MGKGGQNTVVQSGPPAQFLNAYSGVLARAQNVASQPLQQYANGNPSALIAPFSAQQNQAMGEIGNLQGVAQPYINQAQSAIQASQTPIWQNAQQFSPGAVQQYMNPYVSNVVNATQAEFNNQNAMQQNQLMGNAASQGALGGDRLGVAQGVMAGQQQLAQAPVIAGLQQQGYNSALGEFNTQQQAQIGANEANAWLNSQAGFGLSNLGNQALSTGLTSANALMGSGGMQQQMAQEQLNIPYQNFLAQQAYPYQTTQWLGNMAGMAGAGAGGTSTTTPGYPAIGSQIAGGLMSGVGTLGMTGAFGGNGWLYGGAGSLLGGAAADAAGLTPAAATATAAAVDSGATMGGAYLSSLGASVPAFMAKDGGAVPRYADGGDIGGDGLLSDALDTRADPLLRALSAPSQGGMGNPPAPRHAIASHAADIPVPPQPPQNTMGIPVAASTPTAFDQAFNAVGADRSTGHEGMDPWLTLTRAGLATMAGQSPFPLANLGAGALEGINLGMRDVQTGRDLLAKVDEAKARMAEAKDYHDQMADYRGRMADTAASRAASYDQAVQNRAQLGLIQAQTAQLRAQESQARQPNDAMAKLQIGDQLFASGAINPVTGKPFANKAEAQAYSFGILTRQQMADTAASRAASQADLNSIKSQFHMTDQQLNFARGYVQAHPEATTDQVLAATKAASAAFAPAAADAGQQGAPTQAAPPPSVPVGTPIWSQDGKPYVMGPNGPVPVSQ